MPTIERLDSRWIFPTDLSPRTRAALAVLAVSGTSVALLAIGSFAPGWLPPCLLHHLTGLHCPGCGSGRAVQALAHGDIAHAFALNIWMMTVVPLLLARFAVSTWRGLRHDLPPIPLPNGTAMVVLVITILFTIARNLPWWPFSLLAPG